MSSGDTGGRPTASLWRDGEWRPIAARTVEQVHGFRPTEHVELSKYGGWKARQVQATGFFRVEKINERWWFVDPEGYLFISVGMNSVSRGGANSDPAVAEKLFGSAEKWAAETSRMLRERSFNSLGCWSEWRPFRDSDQPLPYFRRWNFMSTYKNRRDPKSGPKGFPNQCMPLFDDEFEEFCHRHARKLDETRDDPWLVGHFSDNELPFRPNLLNLYLELPETDSGHQAAREWLNQHRGTTGRPGDAEICENEQDVFLEYAARRYYSIVNGAIKRYDPNHLFVGSRIHGRTIRESVFRGASDVDVMSINYYHRWSVERERMDKWLRASGRPFINSEWYAMRIDSGVETRGAGFRVRSQRDRGLFYQNHTLGLMEHPGCVGWHWFKYGGDGDGHSRGTVDRQYRPHTELLDVMQALNEQVYPLVAHFLARSDE